MNAMTYKVFWDWFQDNAYSLHHIVKTRLHEDRAQEFFQRMNGPLLAVNSGLLMLIGAEQEGVIELVITVDGNPKCIVYAEELVQAAPVLPGWKFQALKPAMGIETFSLGMGDHQFSAETVRFYPNVNPDYPDEISLCFVYDGINDENRAVVSNGIVLYLENCLGELALLNSIDELDFTDKAEDSAELIAITKLPAYLSWREAEFVEKYDGVLWENKEDNYMVIEGQFPDGTISLALINQDLLQWDQKVSHPWMVILIFDFSQTAVNGMPSEEDSQLMCHVEEQVMAQLPGREGYLNIGRETVAGKREVYFACKDFREPSKVFDAIVQEYADGPVISYEFFKDKYWRSLAHFLEM